MRVVPLNREKILAAANQQSLHVHVFDRLSSTNSWLLENTAEPEIMQVCVTEEQTAGRGRRGNNWLSTPGRNIMCSFAWVFKAWPNGITGLSLAVGMLVAEQLNAGYDLDVKVKWPNDLMCDDRKLGGILIELAGEATGSCRVVVGLGLNVDQSDWSHTDSSYAWQDLQGLGVALNRNEFIGNLSRELTIALRAFENHGFAPLVNAWPRFSTYQGRKIQVGDQHSNVIGVMQGVDEEGALLVYDDQGGSHRFMDSSVSVRLVS